MRAPRLAIFLAFASGPAMAQVTLGTDCARFAKLPYEQAAPEREIFVFVDETTVLDANLKAVVASQVARLVDGATAFQIGRFSAFLQDRYTDIVLSGAVEEEIPADKRFTLPARSLKTFEMCRQAKLRVARERVAGTVSGLLDGANNGIAKSDVLDSLARLSQAVAASKAERRVVLVVSDLLENSAITSFYKSNAVAQIDAKAELAKAEKAGVSGDFGGAEIYVAGGGVAPASAANAQNYRNPKIVQALRDFWNGWFALSNGRVKEIGFPALIRPIE